MRRAQHVGALGHEVDAAENDVVRFGTVGYLARQLERVADVVGELDHLVTLVVMPEDHQSFAELGPCRGNPRVHFGVRQAEIPVGQRLALRDALLLELRQERNDGGHRQPIISDRISR
jgi:hypothetical protein